MSNKSSPQAKLAKRFHNQGRPFARYGVTLTMHTEQDLKVAAEQVRCRIRDAGIRELDHVHTMHQNGAVSIVCSFNVSYGFSDDTRDQLISKVVKQIPEDHLIDKVNRGVLTLCGAPNALFSFRYIHLTAYDKAKGIRVRNLAGIHERLQCERLIIRDAEQVRSSILSVFNIAGIQALSIERGSTSLMRSTDEVDWVTIVNNFLREDDMLGCQEALLEAGLDEYAQL